jgi:hypothetical protein
VEKKDQNINSYKLFLIGITAIMAVITSQLIDLVRGQKEMIRTIKSTTQSCVHPTTKP